MSIVIISVVIPCLNEEKAIGNCVVKTIRAILKLKIKNKKIKTNGEVIVVDNGSTDNSAREARKAGAKVILEKRKGYGFALQRGFSEARGEIIVMGDGDGTYDFSELSLLINKINEGYDLVIGSRFLGKMQKGAMPFLNKILGTPFINLLFKIYFRINLTDTQSGFRAFKKSILEKTHFSTGGMEFASEMIFKTIRAGLRIGEVPVSYSKRIGTTKLFLIRDGWRHFKFLLLFSPTHLFIVPGSIIFILGITMVVFLSFGPFKIFSKSLDVHSMLVFSFLTILGFQIIFLGLFAKTYAYLFLQEKDLFYQKLLERFTLEKGILIGGGFFLCGLAIFLNIFYIWGKGGFGALVEIRMLILSITLIMLGLLGVFSSFFFALLGSGEGRKYN